MKGKAPLLVVALDEGAEEGTAPLRSALFLVFMSSVTFFRPEVTPPPCKQESHKNMTQLIESSCSASKELLQYAAIEADMHTFALVYGTSYLHT